MSTDAGTIDFLLDQLGGRHSRFSTRRMFGEYCLYRDGVPIALICDDVLYVKDTPPGREAMAPLGDVDFAAPFEGARPHLRVPPDLWDERDALRQLLDVTAAALPPPKAKKAAGAEAPAAPQRAASKRAAAATEAKPAARAVRDPVPASGTKRRRPKTDAS